MGFWNIRGFNSPKKLGDVKKFLDHHSVGLFGLLETRVRSGNFPKVFARFGGAWSIATNYSYHKRGRVWFLWLPTKYTVNIIECSAQFIHSEVTHISTGQKWWVTMVYGFNEARDKAQLWEDIVRLSRQINGAWVVCGDFNNVLHLNERLGSNITLDEVSEFRLCLRMAKLQEQTTSDPFYTWSNK